MVGRRFRKERLLFMVNVSEMAVGPWMYYTDESMGAGLDRDKCGKWMHFTSDTAFAARICRDAVERGIVRTAKHTAEGDNILCCFYLECDDMDAHKRVLSYFLENDLIRRTKTGKLYNISFKLDVQTKSGDYGPGFKSDIKLSQFVDLTTGKWILG